MGGGYFDDSDWSQVSQDRSERELPCHVYCCTLVLCFEIAEVTFGIASVFSPYFNYTPFLSSNVLT